MLDSVAAQVPPRLSENARLSAPAKLALLLAAAGAMVVLYSFNPSEHGFYPFCLFYRTTGLLCPGCGGLRAMHQLLHGHLLEALRFNVLLVAVLPLAFLLGIRHVLARARGEATPVRLASGWIWFGGAVLVIFGVLRNLPFAHAAWLAP